MSWYRREADSGGLVGEMEREYCDDSTSTNTLSLDARRSILDIAVRVHIHQGWGVYSRNDVSAVLGMRDQILSLRVDENGDLQTRPEQPLLPLRTCFPRLSD
jgi:hypothetical protein